MRLSVDTLSRPLRVPFTAVHGTITYRPLVLVDAGGRRRHGRLRRGGSPGVLLRRFDRRCPRRPRVLPAGARRLSGPRAGRRRGRPLRRGHDVSPALAAIDLALWDLAGKRARQPIWRLLGARVPAAARPQVEVNWTIAAADRSGAAEQAAEARVRGSEPSS